MRLSLLFLLASPLAATTITGTITDPAGDLVSGACVIQSVSPFTSAEGWRVTGAPMSVKFVAGALSATLAETDTATPSGQYYRVTCSVPQQIVNGRSVGAFSWGPRYWIVPTSADALDVSVVEQTSSPSPPTGLTWSQLPRPPSTGTYCIQANNSVVGWAVCGSSGSSRSFSTLTPAQFNAITPAQFLLYTP